MKVDFKEMATLVIVPENQMENYALKKWFDGYTSEKPSEEILRVNLLTVGDRSGTE